MFVWIKQGASRQPKIPGWDEFIKHGPGPAWRAVRRPAVLQHPLPGVLLPPPPLRERALKRIDPYRHPPGAAAARRNLRQWIIGTGYEDVVAMKGGVGVGIARFPSNEPIADQLRAELHALTSRKRCDAVAGQDLEMRVHKYDSFGESAFSVELRRVEQASAADGARRRPRSFRQRRG